MEYAPLRGQDDGLERMGIVHRIDKDTSGLLLVAKTQQALENLQSQFKEHSSTAIIAALSFVIGLTWKDFIVKIIDNLLKPHIVNKYPYLSELITAIVVTLFAIIAITFVSRWAHKQEKERLQEI